MVAKWILQLQTLLPPTILFRKKENVSFPSSQKCWASSCLDQISSYVHFWISHCNWTSYVYTDWKIGVGISLDFMEIVPWTRVSPPKCLPAMQWGVHDSLSTYPHLFNMPIGSFLIVKVSSLLYRKIAHNQQSKGSILQSIQKCWALNIWGVSLSIQGWELTDKCFCLSSPKQTALTHFIRLLRICHRLE